MGSERKPDDVRRKKSNDLQNLTRLVMLGLTVAAVVREMRLPPDERTWNGVVAGFVPYDFRMPTVERFKERVWDPEGAHVISPHVFGVGWTVNVGRVVALIRHKVSS